MGYSIKRLKPAKQRAHPDNADRAEQSLISLLHAVDPYDGFDHEAYPNDLAGWGSDSEAFEKLVVSAQDPKLIIEVGTWKGGSAIRSSLDAWCHFQLSMAACSKDTKSNPT